MLLVLYPFLLLLVEQGALSYDRLLASASQVPLHLTEGSRPTTLVAGERDRIFLENEALSTPGSHVPRPYIETRVLHVNLAFLVALLLATPGLSSAQRARLTLICLGVLFASHVLLVLVYTKYIYAVRLGDYGPFHYGPTKQFIYQWSYVFLRVVGKPAFPFVIWAAALIPVFFKKTHNSVSPDGRLGLLRGLG